MKFIKKIKLKLKQIKKIRNAKMLLNLYSRNNCIEIHNDDLISVHIKVEGKGNTICVKKTRKSSGVINITIVGNNNKVIIDDGCIVSDSLDIYLGQNHHNFGPIENTELCIGKNCTFESCKIITFNSNSKIKMGTQCMVSYNVNLYHTDGHPIMDYNTGHIINRVKDMNIGEHVWLGANCTILKNSNIPDNSIVGWGSIVSGKYFTNDKSGIILVGNPAQIIKRGISWDANGSNDYVQNIGD